MPVEETVTTEERINPDGTKTFVTKTVRKKTTPIPATINGGTREESRAGPNPDGSPVDGGTAPGDGGSGTRFCCVPLLCTVL